VRERHEDLLAVAAPLDDLAVGLDELVLPELDRDRHDGDRDHGDSRQRLLRARPGRQVVVEDLAVDGKCLLARADRLGVVLPRPAAH
jgi:hypothetical protein